MKRVHIPSISNNSEVVVCAIISVADINVKLNKLNGYAYNYVLALGDEIVYIGYSSSLYSRLVYHKQTKIFDKVLLIEFTNKRAALSLEKKLIKEYRPKHNVQYLQ